MLLKARRRLAHVVRPLRRTRPLWGREGGDSFSDSCQNGAALTPRGRVAKAGIGPPAPAICLYAASDEAIRRLLFHYLLKVRERERNDMGARFVLLKGLHREGLVSDMSRPSCLV